MPVNSAFWRSLRQEFERLQGYQFSAVWDSHPPLSFAGEPLHSQWSWMQFPDDSLRTRLSAIALKGARALGDGSEEDWYDRLRACEFVGFELTGRWRQRRFDGVMVEADSGQIDDVVKESITLCYELEVQAESASFSTGAEDFTPVAEPQSASPVVRIMQRAMHERGLNAPKLTGTIRAILKRYKSKKVTVDRSTIYRIVSGETQKPQPALVKALIEALQLSGEDASIVQSELRNLPRTRQIAK